ncbi:MAG: mannitol dehydrogenase family protein [Clostridiaceae bacterium]|jgi:fructuronate reductase|nr:mannitol dehydrogenase family protein [Clostridiaceae bacterium]
MKKLYLNLKALDDRESWESQGIKLPSYSISEVRERTIKSPRWLHFGAGNLFKVYLARIHDELLERGFTDSGVIVAANRNVEVFKARLSAVDNLILVVGLRSDAQLDLRVVGCISDVLAAIPSTSDWERISQVFRDPNFQVVSYTITEKGYALFDSSGAFTKEVQEEMSRDPHDCKHLMGITCLLLYERYLAGRWPLTLLSMDNLSQNGSVLSSAVKAYATSWVNNGFMAPSFLKYLDDETRISFPWSMIDKITPASDPDIAKILESKGFFGTPEHGVSSFTFANAEEAEYLVIEDSFTNGRPKWDARCVIFTSRDVVDKVEAMKVSTCLNPLHTALAIYGCLLSFEKINDEMTDPDLINLISGLGYKEGLPVVVDPEIIDPKIFLDTVIRQRFSNPFVPDTPQRIATDTSQKMSVRFGNNIRRYREKDEASLDNLVYIPAVIAGWLRYLMGLNDQGEAMTLSPDPMINRLKDKIKAIEFGADDETTIQEALMPILSNQRLFGQDLTKTSLAPKIIRYFRLMNQGKGAVRRFLKNLPRYKRETDPD